MTYLSSSRATSINCSKTLLAALRVRLTAQSSLIEANHPEPEDSAMADTASPSMPEKSRGAGRRVAAVVWRKSFKLSRGVLARRRPPRARAEEEAIGVEAKAATWAETELH